MYKLNNTEQQENECNMRFFKQRKLMNEEKYYTPEIEEFHVGFEARSFYSNAWQLFTIGNGNSIIDIKRGIDEKRIKVKYIDKEDVESFNWKDYNFYFIKQIINNNFHEIQDTEGNVVFYGTIKNKSELKKLMKQLNIV